VLRITVWLISLVITNKILRKNPLLKIDAWVLFFIVNIVLFVAESFSEIFCKNYFETILFLIQFKYAPISNRAIVSILKSFQRINVIFMIHFFKVIWVKTCRKFSEICSIFNNANF
jgi:hypothetical protein